MKVLHATVLTILLSTWASTPTAQNARAAFDPLFPDGTEWEAALEGYAALKGEDAPRYLLDLAAFFFERNSAWELATEIFTRLARESTYEVERSSLAAFSARLLLESGRLSEARDRALDELTRVEDRGVSAELHWTLGMALWRAGELGAGRAALVRAAELDERLENDLCRHLASVGDAREAFLHYAQLDLPALGGCWNGVIWGQQDYHARRVRSALAAGRLSTAREWLEPYLELSGGDPSAAVALLVRLERRAGRLEYVASRAGCLAPRYAQRFLELAYAADRGEWGVLFAAMLPLSFQGNRGDANVSSAARTRIPRNLALELLLEHPDAARSVALRELEGEHALWATLVLAALRDPAALPAFDRGVETATTVEEVGLWIYTLVVEGSEDAFARLDRLRLGADPVRAEAARLPYGLLRVSRSQPLEWPSVWDESFLAHRK